MTTCMSPHDTFQVMRFVFYILPGPRHFILRIYKQCLSTMLNRIIGFVLKRSLIDDIKLSLT